jgi:hypothetical protein
MTRWIPDNNNSCSGNDTAREWTGPKVSRAPWRRWRNNNLTGLELSLDFCFSRISAPDMLNTFLIAILFLFHRLLLEDRKDNGQSISLWITYSCEKWTGRLQKSNDVTKRRLNTQPQFNHHLLTSFKGLSTNVITREFFLMVLWINGSFEESAVK